MESSIANASDLVFLAERKITHNIANQFIAGFSQILDELGVQFVVCVPGSTSQGDGRLDTLKHVYLPGDVLFGKVRNAMLLQKRILIRTCTDWTRLMRRF